MFTLLGLVGINMLGCSGEIPLGAGPEGDARLTADIFTWECTDLAGSFWEGVYAFNISLEYAPDGVQERELPAPGECSGALSMFPTDAGGAGADLPDKGVSPAWSTSTDSGDFVASTDGFWSDEVLDATHTCNFPEDVVSSGVELVDAGQFSGAQTPPAGQIVDVTLSEDASDGLVFGEEVEIDWTTNGWEESWIQVRMEREGESWGSVTCNTTGLDSFTLDDRVWGELNGDLNVEYINLYVGFQNRDEFESSEGLKVETVTRAVHVEVIGEL
jgi:hypothetical protein